MARHAERAEHSELMAAIVAHTVASFAGKSLKDSSKLTYADFMPSQRNKKPVNEKQEAVASLRGFFAARAEAQKQKVVKGERLGS